MAKITVQAARELADALGTAADAAQARGDTEFDLLEETKDLLSKEQAELAQAITEAKKKD